MAMSMRQIRVSFAAVLAAVVMAGCQTSSTPSPTMSWETRLKTQQLYFSAPNYYAFKQSEAEVNKILDALLFNGLDGPSVEFGGRATADEYNGNPDAESVASAYRRNIKQWDVWEKGLRARGLVAHIAFLNTNTARNNKISDAEWVKLANEFLDRHGIRNKVILPASETDGRTRSSIRTALDRAFRARGAIVLKYGGSSGLREYHSQNGRDVPRGNKDLYVVSDSGPAIAYLYGGDWRNGGKPNLANITAYVTAIANAGASGAVYSFGREFDYRGCEAAGKAWGKR